MPTSKSVLCRAIAAALVLGASLPASARFVSVDPVQTNQKTGENFNRYWYAANNPYKFTDPDGRYITFGGDDTYKEKMTGRLSELTSADPLLRYTIQTLEQSPLEHKFSPLSERPPEAIDPADPNRPATGPRDDENSRNGVGSASDTFYDPDVSLPEAGRPGYGSPQGILAHEVSHVYDADQGRKTDAVNPETGQKVIEERGNYLEKRYVDSLPEP